MPTSQPKQKRHAVQVDANAAASEGGRAADIAWIDRSGKLAGLTAQQQAILVAFVRDPNDQRIARRFGLSPQTIRNHLVRAQKRLRVQGRVELMKAALLAMLDLDSRALVKTTKETSGNSN